MTESDYMGAAGQSSMTLKRKFQSQSNYGPVFTKVRIMIVVACYESSYIALPLYVCIILSSYAFKREPTRAILLFNV